MTFKPEISIGDIVASASFLVVGLGLFLTLWQLRRDAIWKRAESMTNVLYKYMDYPDTSEMFYTIDYDLLKCGPGFRKTAEERHLDRLLTCFETVAQLYAMKVIRLDDLKRLRYEFHRVSKNQAVLEYLSSLDALGVDKFQQFRKVAASLESGHGCSISRKSLTENSSK